MINKYFLKKSENISLIVLKDQKIIEFKNNINKIVYILDIKNLKTYKEFYFFSDPYKRTRLKFLVKKSFYNINLGFFNILELIGLGYSVSINKKKTVLRFNIGFNHSIFYNIPKNIKIKTKRKRLYLFSFSFFILRKVIIEIKNFRQLSIYKLKGIKEKNVLYVKKNWKKNIN